ncbi:MAG: UDP-N-acetylmuramoyl-tripeptide--D-alanyl-D-alanine ligase [Firmicutes bacterium]|jgi:UDP-N-acetylmuramoyl-tripeptide--D-alanyl-D-alanine ligase|uniref:UDP-N-acetylmuramoyl-tripeptide--D-alanyl-D-alanine ligase n=1 Tax=Sulfobacillus benefaciens TaxID=453960 RepID=A0A2T2X706_9FIRM|nr:UDP-N-acetylmuramoyl-tripeptide--D-alanyl-D-alanine ligase [Bacillota bacterium]MCL5013804.1 UDP-N-acetylmuramoyl-tripeptide--D-alanyl-D-alanine ligase [Bacillota bacterium]PSR30238.1 MAG: UDP-N-acetylmuramoyl-tripeptide--D-alanyl-D-alanine ligase [Sulfobacillus benefaciens]
MMELTFKDVAEICGAHAVGVRLDDRLRDITIDSREVRPGTLFVALPGSRTHGHQFVPEVWHQGGVALTESTFDPLSGPALVVESPLQAMGQLTRTLIERRHITVVGITGSVGKTSLKELVAAVLASRFVVGKSQGNYNTAIGIPLSFLHSPDTMTHFVSEMGMRALGEIRTLTQITPPEVAVITNIGPNHLESLGSIANIQRAKGEILEGLREGGTAILNNDDPLVRQLGENLDGYKVLWFGYRSGDVVIKNVRMKENETEVTLWHRGQVITLRVPWLGRQHGYTVAAALLVGNVLGLDYDEISRGLQGVDPGTGRLQRRKIGSLTVFCDYYNASPASMKMSLEVLKAQPSAGRRIAVLGDMLELGSQEITAHEEVGTFAGHHADLILAVGSRAHQIAQAANAERTSCAEWVGNLEEAMRWIHDNIREGDVILLKASHGMNFETLYEKLADWGGPQ